MLTSLQIVGLLAEPNRRRVVAALALANAPLTPNEIAEAATLGLRSVVDALDRLDPLVTHTDGAWRLVDDAFGQAARAEAAAPPPSAFDDEPDDIARVLDSVFVEGRLTRLPAKRSKRVVVLDHLAQRFEIGQRYLEAEVNRLLAEVHDDVAMLRRYLVDEQFLDRSGGEYWRCGGSV